MRTLAALVALVVTAALSACGGDSGLQPATSAETEETTPPVTETAGAPPATVTDDGAVTGEEPAGDRLYEIWRVDGQFLRPDLQLGPGGQAVARTALDLLLAKTDTAVPAGTDLRAVHAEGPAAHVDLSAPLGMRPVRLALAQVVYTVTQFENVQSVLVTIEGEPLPSFAEPLTRDDFEDVVAPVVVLEPTGLEPVTSPIRVAGTANTFEANVSIRVLDESGKKLVSTFTTATCGSGCRGDFDESIEVEVSEETPVRLVVSEDDPSGGEGRPPYEVEIPLVLRP